MINAKYLPLIPKSSDYFKKNIDGINYIFLKMNDGKYIKSWYKNNRSLSPIQIEEISENEYRKNKEL